MMHNNIPGQSLLAILLLVSGICFADENNNGLKVETTAYKDLAFNVTHSLGG
jgi:hypothetical protein